MAEEEEYYEEGEGEGEYYEEEEGGDNAEEIQKRMSEMEIRSKIPWKKNASRHSFGSYRMAEIKNVYQVAEEMGNSPAMVKKHYFQAVTKAEASKFWAIRP
jgi:hypothetical protein